MPVIAQETLGTLLGKFRKFLEHSWALLGASWASLGVSWEPLGILFKFSLGQLGRPEPHLQSHKTPKIFQTRQDNPKTPPRYPKTPPKTSMNYTSASCPNYPQAP